MKIFCTTLFFWNILQKDLCFILKVFHFTNFWKKIIRHLGHYGLNFQLLIKTLKSLEEQNALNRCDISADLKHFREIQVFYFSIQVYWPEL